MANEKCKKCIYSTPIQYDGKRHVCCFYICIAGHSRQCTVEDCEKYKQKKRTRAVKYIW